MDGKASGSALRSMRALFGAGAVGGLTDGQLLERFAARDDGGEGPDLAFAGLVERHGPMVLRVCRALLGDEHEAEDAFQATFLILTLRAGSIRGRDSLASWLYSVAYNVAATARVSAIRRRSHEAAAGRERPHSSPSAVPDDSGPAIHAELDRIPERYRVVLILCGLEGLTQHQAAERLGWPIGTVQSRLARGRERLRTRLARRGLTPTVVLASAIPSEAAVPAALANSTIRLAATIAGARALVVGTVPAAVWNLVKNGGRTMLMNKVRMTGAVALLAAGLAATGTFAFQSARPEPADAPAKPDAPQEAPAAPDSEDVLLTVDGVVRRPDGSPAAGAMVQSKEGSHEALLSARADEAGRFRLRGMFGNGCNLHASSADGRFQMVRKISSVDVRTTLAAPVELTLEPTAEHEVVVLAEGRPAAGVQVVAWGDFSRGQGSTGTDGKVRLRLPAKDRLAGFVAWHPTLGAGGRRAADSRVLESKAQLSLLPPAPHTIHVVDVDGKPVGGVELALNVRTEDSDWIVTQYLDASYVRTDADGRAVVPWAPREKLQYIEVDFTSPDWKVDKTDRDRMKDGLTTVHARREHAVQGRLVMPEGADAEGILITGFGFGPGNNGDIPYARSRRDGSFRLHVPSEHGFVLGVVDLKWACDPWMGQILPGGSTKPAEIVMKVYPATPLTVRVTRGERHEPVRNAWVDLSSRGHVNWTDIEGKPRSGTGRVGAWLMTDADGVARAGVGKGTCEVRMVSGDWEEKKILQVTSGAPVEATFHRAWSGEQKIVGRLTLDGAPYRPSPTVAVRAWTPPPEEGRIPDELTPVVRPDGTFELAFDAASATLVFLDRERGRAAYLDQAKGGANVDAPMTPTATYDGILVDGEGRPVAGQGLVIRFRNGTFRPIVTGATDKAGRFRFAGVPAGVPLQVNIRYEPGDADQYIADGERLFEPGEVRENDRLTLHRYASTATPPRLAVPLSESVDSLCKKAGPSGMRALVALLGDDSGDASRVVDSLFAYDDERTKAVLSYLTLRVDSTLLAKEAATVDRLGWPRPAAGEVMLVALDGDRKTVATGRIAVKDVEAAISAGAEFLKRNRRPPHDAPTLLTKARAEAKRTGRRVWVIEGGPRCGPCFRLARWIEDHHATVDKDYVVVKLMEGLDERVPEAVAGLPIEPGDGIPWFAITEPDGAVLTHSRGPLGNIGFPSSLEGIRHFRRMIEQTARTLTPDEVERLVKSLSPGQ